MERRGELRGADVVRHYGDPPGEWTAATESVAMRDRSHRVRLLLHGRAPASMLKGVVTGRMPDVLEALEPGVWQGRAEYSVVLTPKGRTLSDLRLMRRDASDDAEGPLVADVPRAGNDALRAHLARFLPPRMCAVEDVSAETGHLTVMGPDAAAVLARAVLGLRVDTERLEAMGEDDALQVDIGGAWPLTVVRSCEVSVPAWDLISDRESIAVLIGTLEGAAARSVGSGVWEALRLEAGRPAFGADLTEDHIPVEAGVHTRAIDYQKGCYTGQEVIVRIRDRGHVNRHLRRLVLGDSPVPPEGTALFAAGSERSVGEITSAATSPRGGTLALGYVRREVEVPGTLHLGAPDGPEIRVEPLPDA